MDTSNKHTANSFNTLKMYAKGIIDEYNIGVESRGSLFTYDNAPKMLVDIESKTDRKDVKAIIDSLQFNRNNPPNLAQGLNEIIQQLNKRQNLFKDRPVNVLILAKGRLNTY